MFEDDFVSLSSVNFFSISANCYYISPDEVEDLFKYKKYLLPSTANLTHEEHFADINMGWNEEGLSFYCHINTPFKDVFYPSIARGDSLELFIDTRDVKTQRFTTKFCHHLFFLPQELDGVKLGEITRFRGDEKRELVDVKDIHFQSDIQKKSYTLKIFIPSQSLYGYDPDQCDHLGFTYRVNRCGRAPQHFSAITEEFAFEQQPSLWSSLRLIHEDSSL